MKTVLYVVDSLGLSGKTSALTNLALSLDRERYRGVVVSFAKPDGFLPEQLAAGGVQVEHVPCSDGIQPFAVTRLNHLVRQLQPSIVHCFNPRPMLYGGIAASLGGRPAVGTLSAFACMGDDRNYTFLPQPLHTRSRKNRLRNRIVAALMRRIATVSARAGRAFCELNRVSLDKLRVINYGVDVDGVVSAEAMARVRAEFGAAPGEILVGSVGRLVEQKDYPNQLRALALMAHRSPIRMLVAGAGPLAETLRSLARRLRIEDRVSWLGERTDVPAVLRCLDAFVINSKFEPFGVSVLEAMAAGLPIVSTNVNELPEILDGGRAGVLVPAEQPEELADALERVSIDSDLRARIGGHAKTIARSRYSLAATVAAYVKLYDEVIEEGSK